MLTVRYSVVFEVTDGQLVNFKSPSISASTTTDFTQEIGMTILVPASTTDQQIYSQGIDQLQMVFFMADQELAIKLVPTSGSLGATPSLTLLANKPSLISVKNIKEIYISNAGTALAKLTLQAVGNDI